MKLSRAVLLLSVGWFLAGAVVGESAELLDVRTAVDPKITTFFLQIPGPVTYTPAWIGSRTYAIDLTGVTTGRSSNDQTLSSPLVSSYRVLNYQGAGGAPHVRLEVTLKQEAQVDAKQHQDGIEIQFREASARDSAPDSNVSGAALPAVPARVTPGTAIREIQVARRDDNSAVEVEIFGNGSLDFRTMQLSNPERLVLDILNVTNRIRQKDLAVNSPPLRSVRVGQFSRSPMVSRVVLDLDSKTPFQVRPQSDSLVVTLNDSRGQSRKAEAPAPQPAGNQLEETAPSKVSEATIGDFGNKVQVNNTQSLQDFPSQPLGSVPRELAPPVPADSVPSTATAILPPEPAPHSEAEAVTAEPSSVPAPGRTETIHRPEVATAEPVEAAKAASDSTLPERPKLPEVVSEPAVPQSLDSVPASASNGVPSTQVPASTGSTPSSDNISGAALLPKADANPAQPKPKVLLAQEIPAPPGAPTAPPPAVPSQQTEPAPTTPPPAPVGPTAIASALPHHPTYSGEPISVNLKDVDLKDFFRLIHEISGLNIVLDPTVSGMVTVVLDEVPWDQALEIVMKNNGLAKEVQGNVVRIAKISTLESEQKQARDLAIAAEQAQPRTTVTRTLSYAKALDLIPTLRRFLSARGDIIQDNRTNTLIITDIADNIPQFDRLIQILDRKTQQVEIEARVVSASRSFAREIGTQLAASGLTGNVVLGGAGVVGTSPINRSVTPPLFSSTSGIGGTAPLPQPPSAAAQPLLTNLGAAGATSGLTFLLTSGSTFALDAIITAAESRGVGKLLSRPKIITQNNTEATVKQGVRIPLQTTINNTISVQYIDVVLRLTVTPQITADGTIFLKTDIENTSIDPGISVVPGQFALDTQAAQTQVLVSNGGTVFFGGVVANINRVAEEQVPLLGSVPLVGNLFKHKATTSTTNELLFFITPRIVQS